MKKTMTMLLLLLLVASVQSVSARSFSSERFLARNDQETSLDRAVSKARKEYRGRVISAETDESHGHRSHNIRILTEKGTVRRIRVDPETGQYLPPPRRK